MPLAALAHSEPSPGGWLGWLDALSEPGTHHVGLLLGACVRCSLAGGGIRAEVERARNGREESRPGPQLCGSGLLLANM